MQINASPLLSALTASVSGGTPVSANGEPRTAREKMAAKTLEEGKNALATLKTVKSQSRDAAKEAARRKIEMLKERLKALKFLAASNSKAAARQIAQIARELASAVKNYQAAGGSAADAGDTSEPAAPAPQAAAEGDGPQGGSAAAVEAEAHDAQSHRHKPQDDADADDDAAVAANPYLARIAQQRAAARDAEAKADRAFAADARDLSRQLKAMLQRLKHARRESPDSEDARKSLHAIDALLDAPKTAGGAADPLSLTA